MIRTYRKPQPNAPNNFSARRERTRSDPKQPTRFLKFCIKISLFIDLKIRYNILNDLQPPPPYRYESENSSGSLYGGIDNGGMQSDPPGIVVYIYENRYDAIVSVELYNVHDPEKPPVLELEFGIDPGKSYTLTQSGDTAQVHLPFDDYNIWLGSYLIIRQEEEEYKQTYKEFEGTLFDLDEYVVIAREELKITYRHIFY